MAQNKTDVLRNFHNIINSGCIYLADTHGVYDLLEEPVAWSVPKNTIIFETQMIGDICLTSIDSPLWALCCFRTLFKGYFFADEKAVKEIDGPHILDYYKAVFKNMVCYGPGDTIYERTLSIGGGRGKRERFSQMGFYKFDSRDRHYRPPSRGGPRPENEILSNLRQELIEHEVGITDRQVVQLISNNSGLEGYTYLNDEMYRIFIFSSCAAPDCVGLKNSRKFAYSRPYNTALCKRRMEIIERQQTLQNLQLMELGIDTGIGGSGFGSNEGEAFIYSKEYKKWTKRADRKKGGRTRKR